MYESLNLTELRKTVKTKEDLKNICLENDLNFTDQELDNALNLILTNEEINEDELENVSGGKKLPGEYIYNHIMCKYYCKYCKELVWYPKWTDYWCPVCGKFQKFDKKQIKKC